MSSGAMWLAVCLAGGAQGQELPRATMEYEAFAFPDPSGMRLLTVSEPTQPELLHTVFCSDGRRASVRFDHRQTERDGHNGRETSYNFDLLAGDVFTVVDGTIDADARCFLASDALASSATLLSMEGSPGSGECGLTVERQLASLRGRAVVNCRSIAQLVTGGRLLLAEFARQGNDFLASVVMMDDDRMIFADYRAVFRGERESLWRVGDGGVLAPDGLGIVFLLRRGTSYTIGVDWVGAEGSSLAVFASDGGAQFIQVIAEYWYHAPV